MIYDEITEKNKINFANFAIGLVKGLRVFVTFCILTKTKKHFCYWQDDTIHAYKACIYIVVPQQKYLRN